MAEFTVEISGTTHEQIASELQESLTSSQGSAQIYSETERGIDPLTIVSVLLTGVKAADIIWNWWEGRRRSGIKVTIRTANGQVIELSGIDQKQLLEIILTQDE